MRSVGRCIAIVVAALAISAATRVSEAQSVVRGTIVSRLDGAPLIAAEIGTLDGRIRTRTDERGRFTLRAESADTLRIRALGYIERHVAVFSNDSSIVLEPFATVLPAVTTTAGQRAVRVNETTASAVVIGRDELDARAVVGADQILRRVPGLQQIATPPTKSTIAIRGLDGARVLVLVDGEPVSGASLDIRDIGRLSTVAAERVEVTKGPSSVEFGSDALGGVINIVTAAPSERWLMDATARGGELGRREGTLEVSNTFGRTGVRASGGWRQVDGVTAIDEAGSSLDRVYDLRADVRHRASDRLVLRADANLSRERQRWPVGGGYNGFIDNRTAQAFAEAQQLALGGVLRARVAGQFFDYQYRQALGSSPIAGSADSLKQSERVGRASLAYTVAAGAHAIDVGVQGNAREIVAPQKVDDNRANDRQFELFARDAWTLGAVLMTAGGRWTRSSLWGDAVSPSLGAAWQVAPAWRVRANVARGFRAPGFKEMRYSFANPAAGYVIEGNASLEPESSWSSDAGVTFAPTARVVLELDAYRNRIANLIDTRFEGTNGGGMQVYRNINVAAAHIEGAEVGATISTGSSTVRAGYAYLRARDTESGERLDRRSAHSARIDVSHVLLALAGITTDVSAQYTGAAPVGDTTQAARLAVDAQLRARVMPSLELSVGVNNLFNERAALWTPTFGRQFYAGMRVRLRERD
ncbi:MAG TPA: TonB-dependent receptor [Gemmatimonadaceae bacterium]|nr:TonB-dependent receptor [Gemmatimonadaceae bacterium]